MLAPAVVRPSRVRPLLGVAIAIGSGCLVLALVLSQRDHGEAPAIDARRIADARVAAAHYAYEGLPAWVAAHPEYPCPQHLAELDVYVGRHDTIDPWGTAMQSYCSGGSFRVVSAGPDRSHGTTDDIVEGR